ncbi:MAG: MBL fold metallo-hydrolase [Actinobacteria bacterium HGW-Actinobacteria-2]|nr:MAG: MBL fold metallo-hydrolase [Actinobacteria bacterium HGW-Actinobacteria-2]
MDVDLTFLGGAGTVTGSKFLLHSGSTRVLVDAGVFQGEKQYRLLNWEPFPVPPAELSAVLITHAHTDHVGYLPVLVRDGFAGEVLATEATAELAAIVLRDAAFLAERDAAHAAEGGYSKHQPPLPLFTIGDVEQALKLFRVVDFDTDYDLDDGWSARWTRAGHILGSASIRVQTPSGSVLFSGDLGRSIHPVLRARETPPGADVVLIESTYGDREHFEPDGAAHEPLADVIRRTARRGGSVLVPAFAVDRTEVVLKTITELMKDGRIPTLPVYVNSPMALAALRVYRDPRFADELRPDLDADTFVDLPQLHEVRTTEDSIKLNNPKVPSIIISSSGMATGGRVLHHLEHLLPDDRNAVVLTGYQAVGTRGRSLADGARHLKMHGRDVPVRAEVLTDEEFSVHADASELVDWLDALSPAPRQVYCVHGDPDSAAALARTLTACGRAAQVAAYGTSVSLG